MWKYQCKKHLLILLAMFGAGAILYGLLGYDNEIITSQILQFTQDKNFLIDHPYVIYIAGGMSIAGIANGLLLLMYIIQRYQAPYLFVLLILFMGAINYAILIGTVLLLPCVVVCLYGWFTIPNRGKRKELSKNSVTSVQEVERVYRLHHTYDASYEEMAKKAWNFMLKMNAIFLAGIIAIFLVFIYVENLMVVMLCVLMYMYLFYELTRRKNLALQPIVSLLYEQCDPEACASAIFALAKKAKKKKTFPLPQHLAQCMIYMNDPHLAVDVLVTCNQSRGNFIYAYQSLMSYAYYQLGDRSMVEHAYEECAKAGPRNLKGPAAIIKQQTLDGIKNRLDIMDKNFTDVETYFKGGLETAQFEFQRVDFHYYLGLIAFVDRDVHKAIQHFEYVVAHGNKVYFVDKANNFLKTLRQMSQEM